MKKERANDLDLNMLLYAKERFGISNAAYHELTQLFSNLPRSSEVKQKLAKLNKKWDVFPTPEGTIGVQQSLTAALQQKLEAPCSSAPPDAPFKRTKTIRIKLTGDGTNIGHALHVVVFGFTVVEEGGCSGSSYGNNPVCILREKEDYDALRLGLQDVAREVKTIADNGLLIGD